MLLRHPAELPRPERACEQRQAKASGTRARWRAAEARPSGLAAAGSSTAAACRRHAASLAKPNALLKEHIHEKQTADSVLYNSEASGWVNSKQNRPWPPCGPVSQALCLSRSANAALSRACNYCCGTGSRSGRSSSDSATFSPLPSAGVRCSAGRLDLRRSKCA